MRVLDQYRYVGPALFVLSTMPAEATLVRHYGTREPVTPHDVWIDVLHTWVRLNGEWISGWDREVHFAFRPHWLNRWKLRRAGRRWLAGQPLDDPAHNLPDSKPLPTETHSARPGDCRGGSPTTAAAAFVSSSHGASNA